MSDDNKKGKWEIDRNCIAFRRNGKIVTLTDLLEMLNAAEDAVWSEKEKEKEKERAKQTRDGFTVGDIYKFKLNGLQYEIVELFTKPKMVDIRSLHSNKIFSYPDDLLRYKDTWEKIS